MISLEGAIGEEISDDLRLNLESLQNKLNKNLKSANKIRELDTNLRKLKKEIHHLKSPPFQKIEASKAWDVLRYRTSLSEAVFMKIVSLIENQPTINKIKYDPEGSRRWNFKDILLICLEKLVHDKPYEAFCFDYDISSKSVAHNKIDKMINRLYINLIPLLFHLQDSETIEKNTPERFKQRFPGTELILDGLPLSVKDDFVYLIHQYLFSGYKFDAIGQSLIAISPCGLFQIRSALGGGNQSETTHLWHHGRFLERIKALLKLKPESQVKLIEIKRKYEEMGKLSVVELKAEAERRKLGVEKLSKKDQILSLIQGDILKTEVSPLCVPLLMGDGAYERLKETLGWNGIGIITPGSAPKNGTAFTEEAAIESMEVSQERGLVERRIGMAKSYKGLAGVNLDRPEFGEKIVSSVLALCNARELEAQGRLDQIPTSLQEVEGKFFDPITESLVPSSSKLKQTPDREVSSTIRQLLNQLPSLSIEQIEKDFLPRKKPNERGRNHIQSGHVLKHSLCRTSDKNLLILSNVKASYKKDLEYQIVTETDGRVIIRQYCNCLSGKAKCAHKNSVQQDISDYKNRNDKKYKYPGKYLVIRTLGQMNLLVVSRFLPFTNFKDTMLASVGKQFIVSPVTLNKPSMAFKPTKSDWIEIKKFRLAAIESKKKNGKVVQDCYCENKTVAEAVACKSCHKLFHRECLLRSRKNINQYYCDTCSEKYLVVLRPGFSSFKSIEAYLVAEGDKARQLKKQQNLNALKAKQSKPPKESRRHDLHAGEIHGKSGLEARPWTPTEKSAANDLNGDEIDLEEGVLQTTDFLGYESDDDNGDLELDDNDEEDIEFDEIENNDDKDEGDREKTKKRKKDNNDDRTLQRPEKRRRPEEIEPDQDAMDIDEPLFNINIEKKNKNGGGKELLAKIV